jgi:hypothetical protein
MMKEVEREESAKSSDRKPAPVSDDTAKAAPAVEAPAAEAPAAETESADAETTAAAGVE